MNYNIGSSLTIRHASEADLPAIPAVYNEAILNTTAVYQYEMHNHILAPGMVCV